MLRGTPAAKVCAPFVAAGFEPQVRTLPSLAALSSLSPPLAYPSSLAALSSLPGARSSLPEARACIVPALALCSQVGCAAVNWAGSVPVAIVLL